MLRGARALVARDRPALFARCASPAEAKPLVLQLESMGHRAAWHVASPLDGAVYDAVPPGPAAPPDLALVAVHRDRAPSPAWESLERARPDDAWPRDHRAGPGGAGGVSPLGGL